MTTNEPDPRPADETADAQRRIAELTARIEQARVDYYEHDAPTMADGEYDALEKEPRALEEENPRLASEDSPTRTVGGARLGACPRSCTPSGCSRWTTSSPSRSRASGASTPPRSSAPRCAS
ncbi:hypothetical protein [Brachybacterium sp. GPGPB12]|uniref:hypothetical protein n=1 Tax=Brachybacterium sp. GPGPB12 TaxID=3023517 RepID=UPI0031342A97